MRQRKEIQELLHQKNKQIVREGSMFFTLSLN